MSKEFVSLLWHGSEVIAAYGPYLNIEAAEGAGREYMKHEYKENWDNTWDLAIGDEIGIGVRHSELGMEFRLWWDTIELNKVR